MQSQLYSSHVMHHRLSPRRHRFNYDLFWFCLDLDELPSLNRRVWGFRTGERWQWPFMGYGFYETDHFPDGSADPLRVRLGRVLAQAGVSLPQDARIRVVTQCRLLGYGFNPVCFWFCETRHGEPLAVVAEVQNTFREVKPYVITRQTANGWWVGQFPKHFYVSPFLALDDWFDFRLRWPGETLQIAVHTLDGNTRQPVLVSTFTGPSKPLTSQTLWLLTARHPMVPFAIIAGIHWHALRLWLKRIRFYAKQANSHLQQNLMRPLLK